MRLNDSSFSLIVYQHYGIGELSISLYALGERRIIKIHDNA